MWTTKFGGENIVKLKVFCAAVYGALGETIPGPDCKDDVQLQKYNCLIALAHDDSVEPNQGQTEKKKRVVLLSIALDYFWFGLGHSIL